MKVSEKLIDLSLQTSVNLSDLVSHRHDVQAEDDVATLVGSCLFLS